MRRKMMKKIGLKNIIVCFVLIAAAFQVVAVFTVGYKGQFWFWAAFFWILYEAMVILDARIRGIAGVRAKNLATHEKSQLIGYRTTRYMPDTMPDTMYDPMYSICPGNVCHDILHSEND